MDEAAKIILQTLRRVRWGMWRASALRRFLTTLAAGLAAITVLLALQRTLYSWLPSATRSPALLQLLALIVMASALLVAVLHWRRLPSAARFLDSAAGLHDRAATALGLICQTTKTGHNPDGAGPPAAECETPAANRSRNRAPGGQTFSPMASLVVAQAAERCRTVDLSRLPYHDRRTKLLLRLLAAGLLPLAVLIAVPPYRTAEVRRQEEQQALAGGAVSRLRRQIEAMSPTDDPALKLADDAARQLAASVDRGTDQQAIADAAERLRRHLEQLAARQRARQSLAALSQEEGLAGTAMGDGDQAERARRQLASSTASGQSDAESQTALEQIGRTAFESGQVLQDETLSNAGQQTMAAASGDGSAGNLEQALEQIAQAGRRAAADLARQQSPEEADLALALGRQAEQQARQMAASMSPSALRPRRNANEPETDAGGEPDEAQLAAAAGRAIRDWQARAEAASSAADSAADADGPEGNVVGADQTDTAPATSAYWPPGAGSGDGDYIRQLPLPLRQLVQGYFDRQ